MQDSGGELVARDLDRTPGLVRKTGMSLDDAATRLAGEGYLPELQRDMADSGPEQVDRVGALLDAIDEHQAGRPRLREQDIPAWDEAVTNHQEAMSRLGAVADYLGLTEGEARGVSRGQARDALAHQARGAARRAELDDFDQLPGWDTMTPAERRAKAVNDLKATVDKPDAARAAVEADADRATTAASPDLAAVQEHIAELEARATPDTEVAAAQAGVEQAERRASAIEQAAVCLARSGL